MSPIIHRADSRGFADYGWLQSRHTFSFASYHNPDRMRFGKLRVINDDVVSGGGGFGTHPHDNMEIVSIPLSGALRHRDSMGNTHVIRAGEVQIMSAGTGITHSEYNDSDSEPVNFLQIWILPKQRDIAPRYGQQAFDAASRRNNWQTVVSPQADDGAVWINQDAWFSLADVEAGQALPYTAKKTGNGLYLFVLDGEVEAGGERLARRDAIGLGEAGTLDIRSRDESRLLLIDVAMH